jgi:hypothetical protein
VHLGRIVSAVEQAVAIVDFSNRNDLPLHSADESIDQELARDESKVAEMREVVGNKLFSRLGLWFWFSLNEAPGPLTFPPFPTFKETQAQKAREALELRAKQEAEWNQRNKKMWNFIAFQLPLDIGLLVLGVLQLFWSADAPDAKYSHVLMWSGLATLVLAARGLRQVYKRLRLLAIRPPYAG